MKRTVLKEVDRLVRSTVALLRKKCSNEAEYVTWLKILQQRGERERRKMVKNNFFARTPSTPNPYFQKIEVKLSIFHKIEK